MYILKHFFQWDFGYLCKTNFLHALFMVLSPSVFFLRSLNYFPFQSQHSFFHVLCYSTFVAETDYKWYRSKLSFLSLAIFLQSEKVIVVQFQRTILVSGWQMPDSWVLLIFRYKENDLNTNAWKEHERKILLMDPKEDFLILLVLGKKGKVLQ